MPFFVAAPSRTFDGSTASGKGIQIEQRDGDEVRYPHRRATAPDGVDVYNPAFDVTPAQLVSAIITDAGFTPTVRLLSDAPRSRDR